MSGIVERFDEAVRANRERSENTDRLQAEMREQWRQRDLAFERRSRSLYRWLVAMAIVTIAAQLVIVADKLGLL